MTNTDLIAEARRNAPESVDESLIMRLVVALEAAEPRVVAQLGDLESLPIGSVVLDGDKEVWEMTDDGWHCWIYGGVAFPSSDLQFPATVLHEPEAEATR